MVPLPARLARFRSDSSPNLLVIFTGFPCKKRIDMLVPSVQVLLFFFLYDGTACCIRKRNVGLDSQGTSYGRVARDYHHRNNEATQAPGPPGTQKMGGPSRPTCHRSKHTHRFACDAGALDLFVRMFFLRRRYTNSEHSGQSAWSMQSGRGLNPTPKWHPG